MLPYTAGPLEAAPEDKTVISKPQAATEPPPPLNTMAALGVALTGKRLEHYELTEFVGGGGMGAVFRAIDSRLGRTVAVKVLSRDQTDEETIRRFRNEAQSAARLDHPNIARVYYVGEDRGWNFIVFEFIEGTNLREIVEQRGPLPLEDALDYTLQVAEALAHSSSRDVVHRDIKPSNVLVTAGDQVKLVDMGLARLHQVQSSSDDLTASGVTLGTFDYISPEQARDPRSADVRSDIYSLGCTLYYMLANRPPFPDGTALQKLLRHNADEPPDVRNFRPELPPRVTALLAKMLAKRPSQRHQTAAELSAEILAIGHQLGLARLVQHRQVVLPAAGGSGLLRSRFWQLAAAGLVLAAAVVLADMYSPTAMPANSALAPPRFTGPPWPEINAATGPSEQAATPTSIAPVPSVISPLEFPAAAAGEQSTAPPSEAPVSTPPAAATASTGGEVPPVVPANLAMSLAPQVFEGGIGGELIEAELTASFDALPGVVDPPSDPIKPLHIHVVAGPPSQPDPEVAYVSSLAEACSRAADLNLTEIELAFTGRLLERPFDIGNQRLTIAAQPGARPIVVFQPSATERQMIRLSGSSTSRLKAQGIEFRLELPEEVSSGWALVAINTGQSLEMYDCVLTVQDGDRDRGPIQDQAAMIAVQRRRGADTMTMADPQVAMGQPAQIVMEGCIARGEATLVSMADETPLDLMWTQGLLATTRRLIETGGSDSTARKWFEMIRIDLDSVTAHCPLGLYQMQRRNGRSNHYAVSVTTKRCILMTEPGAPLFEYVGVRELAEGDLEVEGDANRFPRPDMVFLRTVPANPGEPGRQTQLNEPPAFRWRARPSIPWLQEPRTGIPAHELTKADYAVDTSMGSSGFEPTQLPEIAPEGESAVAPLSPP